MNLSLQHKTALVCGSSQGIGLAIAQELALLGANCILLARNPQSLATALASLSNNSQQVHSIAVADFNDNEQVHQVVAQLVQQHPIDILINNTGGPPAGAITQAATSAFISAYQLHLLNNHTLVQCVLPHMQRQQWGRVINIISTSVKVPLPNLGVSNTTRAAVAAWAKTTANEVAAFGITVNNVLPGATATDRLANIIKGKASSTNTSLDAVSQHMIDEIPMKRFAEPHEVAAMAAFLATPAAGYITGQSICVDGGRTGSI
jgi:3-oxoacyl-[acyl-carrier protein] reductase